MSREGTAHCLTRVPESPPTLLMESVRKSSSKQSMATVMIPLGELLTESRQWMRCQMIAEAFNTLDRQLGEVTGLSRHLSEVLSQYMVVSHSGRLVRTDDGTLISFETRSFKVMLFVHVIVTDGEFVKSESKITYDTLVKHV